MSEKIPSDAIVFACRFHPTDWFHEIGCDHCDWSVEQLKSAIRTLKKSHDDFVRRTMGNTAPLEARIAKLTEDLFKSIDSEYLALRNNEGLRKRIAEQAEEIERLKVEIKNLKKIT